jgi:membrane-associated phospholipid phosphatase
VLLYGSPLALAPYLIKRKREVYTIATMYVETLSIAFGGTYLSKGIFTRYRPFVYDDNAPLDKKLTQEATRSFFSGHAALASSTYIFSAKVFSDYYPDSKYKPLVWIGAIGASVTTAAMRVTGGKHFISDVTVGLLWGGMAGYLIPESHRISTDYLSFSPFVTPEQTGLLVNYVF